ncbi:MAG: hypothetical protein AAF415_11795 [Pseudomonadota bacterium]
MKPSIFSMIPTKDASGMRRAALVMLLALGMALMPDPAAAYIGPGAGIGAIATFLALIAAVVLAIVGFLWYPLKRLIKGRKAPEAEDE